MVMDLSHELNEHMDGSGDGSRRADALWRANQRDLHAYRDDCLRVYIQLVTADEDFAGEARAIHFLGVLAQRTPKQPEEAMSVVMDSMLLEITVWATKLEDPRMRTRAMLLVKELLHGAEGRIREATLQVVLDPLMGAFNDKVAKIRKIAVTALSKVAQCEEHGSQVVDAYIRQLEVESNQAVRVAAAQCMPQRDQALETMMARTHDVSPEVRVAIYGWFGVAPADMLSADQRVALLSNGLKDRVPAARDAAAGMAGSWLQHHFGRDVLRFLAAIDVQQNQGVALELLESLTSTKALDMMELLKSGALRSLGSAAAHAERAESGEGGADLQPTPADLAFTWAYVARHLHATASAKSRAAARTTGAAAASNAAMASDNHNLLEAFLPDSASQLACLVRAHVHAGEQHKFAVCQMLGIAGLAMDWTDGTSRAIAMDLIKGLMVADMRDGSQPMTGQTRSSTGDPVEWVWQHAVLNFANKVLPDGRQLLGTVLPTLQTFANSEGAAAEGRLLQCLAYASQLLQCLPKARLTESCGSSNHGDQDQQEEHCQSSSLQWMVDGLLLPSTRHASAPVRSLAMHCVGMFPLLPMGKATLLPAVDCSVRLLEDAAPSVKEEAARVLLNLLLVFGVSTVNDKACKSGVSAMQRGVSDLAGQFAKADIQSQGITDQGLSPGSPSQQAPHFDCLQLLHITFAKAKKQRRIDQEQPKGRKQRADADVPGSQDGLICALVDGFARLALFQELHQVLQARQRENNAGSRLAATQGEEEEEEAHLQGSSTETAGMAITDEEARLILDQLLRTYKDPAFEDIAYIQQILGIFFEAYCRRAAGNKRRLAQALPATFQRAMGISLKGRKTAAPGLVKLTAGLLQMPMEGQQQQPVQDQGTEQLCQDLLQGLHGMSKSPSTADKEYYREVGAMLCLLPFSAAQHPEQLQCCLLLLRRCLSEGHMPTTDRALLKQLAAAKARFESLQAEALGPDAARLTEQDMEALLKHAQLMLQERQRAQQQLARNTGEENDSENDQEEAEEAADSEESEQVSSRARKPRATKRVPVRRGKKAAAALTRDGSAGSDASDADQEDDSAAASRDQTCSAATRQRPQRGAAAKARQQLAASAAAEDAS